MKPTFLWGYTRMDHDKNVGRFATIIRSHLAATGGAENHRDGLENTEFKAAQQQR